MDNAASPRLPYVWDYDIDEGMFRAILAGEVSLGRRAAMRLLEYMPYCEMMRLLGGA